MSKGLEELYKIKKSNRYAVDVMGCEKDIEIEKALDTIEKELQRLEAIDSSKPSEALECLEKLGTHRIEYKEGFELGFTKTMPFKSTMEYKTIQQALLKENISNRVFGKDLINLNQILRQNINTPILYVSKKEYCNKYIVPQKQFEDMTKALEIIIKKNVMIYALKVSKTVDDYNDFVSTDEQLTQEEFDTLKMYYDRKESE